MNDWKRVAAARGVKISSEDEKRLAPDLDRLEKTFAEISRAIPMELLPAFNFSPWPVPGKAARSTPAPDEVKE